MSEIAGTTQKLHEVEPKAKKTCRRGKRGSGDLKTHRLMQSMSFIEATITRGNGTSMFVARRVILTKIEVHAQLLHS